MDIFWLEAVVLELDGLVTDTRINKIHQPTADTLIFRLWTGRENLRLLVSLNARFSRLHLTERDYPNPFTPPRFCQLLRSRLSALTGIRQYDDERIIELCFRGKDGDYRLVVELTGRYGNLVLLDSEGRIVDALKRVTGGEKVRAIQPGLVYSYPPQKLRINLRDTLPSVPESFTSPEDFSKWLRAELSPMSKREAARLAAQMVSGGSPQAILQSFRNAWLDQEYQPRVAATDQGRALLLFPSEEVGGVSLQRFSTVSEALDDYYYPLQFESGQIGDGRELSSLVKKEIKKLRKRWENIATEGEKKEAYDDRRQLGDLLLANLHLIKKGMEQVTVVDYLQDPPVEVAVELDPCKSPQENAETYFKRYKKDKRGMGHVARRLRETEDELNWLESLSLALDDAHSPTELQDIRQELLDAGMIKEQRTDRVHRRVQPATTNFHRCSSPSGLTILWGRNNRTNDEISTRQTGKDDLWFHAHNQPGCHLVLKRGERKGDLPEEDILFAASLAAGYSRARHDHRVEVMLTDGRHVHKPKGVRPGLVRVKTYRTLIVAPRRLSENAE